MVRRGQRRFIITQSVTAQIRQKIKSQALTKMEGSRICEA